VRYQRDSIDTVNNTVHLLLKRSVSHARLVDTRFTAKSHTDTTSHELHNTCRIRLGSGIGYACHMMRTANESYSHTKRSLCTYKSTYKELTRSTLLPYSDTAAWHLSLARLVGSTGSTMSSAWYLSRLPAEMPTSSLLRGPCGWYRSA
jgi:hypothetical protein